jgi:hypothetical protein
MPMAMFKVSVRKPASSVSLSMPPRQKIVDLIDLVVDDTAENISQPSLRINPVELLTMINGKQVVSFSLDGSCQFQQA